MKHFTFFFPELLGIVLPFTRLDVEVCPVHVLSMVTLLVAEVGRAGHITLLKMERSLLDA